MSITAYIDKTGDRPLPFQHVFLRSCRRFFAVLLLILPYISSVATASQSVDVQKLIDESKQTIEINRQYQRRIDHLYESKQQQRQTLRQLEREINSLRRYQEQMQSQIKKQVERLHQYDTAIADAALIERQLLPLLEKMTLALEQFVELDLPFLLSERRDRISILKQNLDDPTIDIASKYHQLLDTYQKESDYGRDLGRYEGVVDIAGEKQQVTLLRVGRIALLCQTLDGQITARWNVEQSKWERLEESQYRHQVKQGLKLVANQVPMQFLTLPIEVPGVKQ